MKEFEKFAIRALACGRLSSDVLESVLSTPESVEYECSGCGYFLTLIHSDLPQDRHVLSEPLVLGTNGEIESGFIVFLGEHKLVLECHPYAVDIPESYREQDIRVRST